MAIPQCEREEPWSPGKAAICPKHSKPGRGKAETGEEHSTVSTWLPAPNLHAWQREMSLVFVLANRDFAPFSSARQMPVGIITLPGECQLDSIRALAGHPTLQVLLCSLMTKAWLQHETRTRLLLKQLPPCSLITLGRHVLPAQPTAGWGWKDGIQSAD